ncbi:hypothetical protein FOZ60_013244 [Perkinsus olseni]|uniref:Uncharacterized protein n=1 Tax=Perkinsus olseni TaxID=32597 RepID=A0A7J6N9M5_PEROL|nr:hypothetical protein FOZ60_013244 [Perkinsus olseni]
MAPPTSLGSTGLCSYVFRGCCFLFFLYGVQAFTVTSQYPEDCFMPGIGPAEGTNIVELLEGACIFTVKGRTLAEYSSDLIAIRLNSNQPDNNDYVTFYFALREDDNEQFSVYTDRSADFGFTHEGFSETGPGPYDAAKLDMHGGLQISFADGPLPDGAIKIITTPDYPFVGQYNNKGFALSGSTAAQSGSVMVTTSQTLFLLKTDEGWKFDISFQAQVRDAEGKLPDVDFAATLAKGVVPA